MKILLTGSSGFLGSHLAPILEKDHKVSKLVSDLRNHQAVHDEVLAVAPDIIVHLAARTEVERSFYEQVTFSEINYVGTVNLIEAAVKVKNLKNFIFASTMEVYGWQPISDEVKANGRPSVKIAFNEHTSPNPNAPYAVAKYACEKYLEYAYRCLGLPFTAIRQTNCYGRKDNDFFVTEQFITQMIKNPERVCFGSAEPYRNFIYVTDMIEAWTSVINNSNLCSDGSIFTIGPNEPIKIKDWADLIAKKLGWQGQIQWNQKPYRAGEIFYLNSDHSLITEKLGWAPKVSSDQGLDLTIEFWQNLLKNR